MINDLLDRRALQKAPATLSDCNHPLYSELSVLASGYLLLYRLPRIGSYQYNVSVYLTAVKLLRRFGATCNFCLPGVIFLVLHFSYFHF